MNLAAAPLAVAGLLIASVTHAQTGAPGLPAGESQLRVQVLNGRSGRPVVNTHVLLIGDNGFALDGSRDNPGENTDGEGYAPLPGSPRSRQLHLYVEGFVPCSRGGRRTFALDLMATLGIVSTNECSSRIRLFSAARVAGSFRAPGALVGSAAALTRRHRMAPLHGA